MPTPPSACKSGRYPERAPRVAQHRVLTASNPTFMKPSCCKQKTVKAETAEGRNPIGSAGIAPVDTIIPQVPPAMGQLGGSITLGGLGLTSYMEETFLLGFLDAISLFLRSWFSHLVSSIQYGPLLRRGWDMAPHLPWARRPPPTPSAREQGAEGFPVPPQHPPRFPRGLLNLPRWESDPRRACPLGWGRGWVGRTWGTQAVL